MFNLSIYNFLLFIYPIDEFYSSSFSLIGDFSLFLKIEKKLLKIERFDFSSLSFSSDFYF